MSPESKTAHILIIEDAQGIARALNRALGFHKNGRYHVETIASGELALERLHERPFDLVISDLRLPGIDGLDLLERVHQITPQTRSILITAFGSPEVEERARVLADAYLPKPFRLQDILRLVERILSQPPVPRPSAPEHHVADVPKPSLKMMLDRRKSAHLIVIASDLDGTLAEAGHVPPQVFKMLREAKTAGLILILVTGRTLDTFLAEGPFADLCEAIVAENGAVVYFPRRDAVLLPFGRLDPLLLTRLEARSVPLERGMAIVATHEPHDREVLRSLREVKSGANMEYNLNSVMVLPQGATKGSGLLYALRELGYSPRNVVACGDAENDRSLFDVAELSAAVSNARPTLKALADVVLPHPNGTGVQALINDLLDGRVPQREPRPQRRLRLGRRMSGIPVYLDPFALVQNNMGIFGASTSGKSWLAGLMAEEMLKQGYQMCIIDPEGDYRGLSASPRTLLFGGPETPLPAVQDVLNFTEWNVNSLVLDLSMYTYEERIEYVMEFLRALRSLRIRRGRPHCFLVDEIQNLCPREGGPLTDLFLEAMRWGGFSVISYRPSLIAPKLLAALDHWLLTRLSLPEELETIAPRLSHCTEGQRVLEELPALTKGQAFLCPSPTKPWPSPETRLIKFQVGQRAIPHIRHLHKYLRAPLPEPKRFYFYGTDENYLSISAANLWEFREALRDVPPDALARHLERGDFELWIQGVLHDDELARRIRKTDNRNLTGTALRNELLAVVTNRYEELDSLA